jgi:hypothetical protein
MKLNDTKKMEINNANTSSKNVQMPAHTMADTVYQVATAAAVLLLLGSFVSL